MFVVFEEEAFLDKDVSMCSTDVLLSVVVLFLERAPSKFSVFSKEEKVFGSSF